MTLPMKAAPRSPLFLASAFAALTLAAGPALANDVQKEREAKVAADVKKMQADDFWIYNDLAKAKEIATDSKRPLMIVFR